MTGVQTCALPIYCDLPEPLDDLLLKGIPEDPLRAFLEHHGFRSLLTKLGGGPAAVTPSVTASAPIETASVPETPFDLDAYDCVTTLDALDRWIAEATTAGVVAVDTETDGLDATQARIIGFSLATAPGKACYVPLAHGGTDLLAEKPEQIDRKSVV